MKKLLSLFSLLGLVGLFTFLATPIYAQDIEDDVSAAETSYNEELDYGLDENGIALEDTDENEIAAETTDEENINLNEEVDFTSIFENEEVKNSLEELDMSNEEAVGLIGLFAGLGVAGLILVGVILLVWIVLIIIALRKAFTKAGEAGWKSIIPIYNSYIMYKIAGMKNWFWYTLLISIILGIVASILPNYEGILGDISGGFGFIVGIIALFKFARKYEWSVLASILFVLFYPICILILGFGKYKYLGRSGNKTKTIVEV